MFTDLFFVAVLIIGSIVGTYTDIKRREVPDWINYFLISVGIGGHILVSLVTNSIYPIFYSLLGAFAFFILANLLFYSGSWGGGDAKFLVGVGSLLPIYPITLLNFLNPFLAGWPFLLTLFFNIIFFGAIFGIIYAIYTAIKNWKKVNSNLREIFNKKPVRIVRIFLLVFPVVLAFYMIISYRMFLMLAFVWIFLLVLFYLLLLALAVEDIKMFKKVKPSNLTEGDWIAEDVKVSNKTVYKKRKIGIELKDINKLKRLESEGKLNKVKIKEGLPFLPAFLAGIIFSLFAGDILFYLIGSVF